MSISETVPELVGNDMMPTARLSMEVSPAEKSCVIAPPLTLSPPARVLVATVLVAVKMSATTPVEPTTESAAYGEVVPMPTNPELVTMKLVKVEEPTTNCGAPAARLLAFTERRPQGVEVPKPVNPFGITMRLGDEVPWSETTNAGAVPGCSSMEKLPQGVDVAKPVRPELNAVRSGELVAKVSAEEDAM
jgi:hypothetical protein